MTTLAVFFLAVFPLDLGVIEDGIFSFPEEPCFPFLLERSFLVFFSGSDFSCEADEKNGTSGVGRSWVLKASAPLLRSLSELEISAGWLEGTNVSAADSLTC